jgi:hypothetical protein
VISCSFASTSESTLRIQYHIRIISIDRVHFVSRYTICATNSPTWHSPTKQSHMELSLPMDHDPDGRRHDHVGCAARKWVSAIYQARVASRMCAHYNTLLLIPQRESYERHKCEYCLNTIENDKSDQSWNRVWFSSYKPHMSIPTNERKCYQLSHTFLYMRRTIWFLYIDADLLATRVAVHTQAAVGWWGAHAPRDQILEWLR